MIVCRYYGNKGAQRTDTSGIMVKYTITMECFKNYRLWKNIMSFNLLVGTPESYYFTYV